MDVHVRDLRYFIAVAEELHFRKAAERLFVSQPVLSRQIARLETMVQARLLERDHRLVRLTPAGEYLLGRVRWLGWARRSAMRVLPGWGQLRTRSAPMWWWRRSRSCLR